MEKRSNVINSNVVILQTSTGTRLKIFLLRLLGVCNTKKSNQANPRTALAFARRKIGLEYPSNKFGESKSIDTILKNVICTTGTHPLYALGDLQFPELCTRR